MKVNFNSPILSLAGLPIKQQKSEDDSTMVELTLRHIAVDCLMNLHRGHDENISGDEKARLCDMAMAIYDACEKGDGWVDMEVDQLATIKKRLERVQSPLVVGRARQIFKDGEVKVDSGPEKV